MNRRRTHILLAAILCFGALLRVAYLMEFRNQPDFTVPLVDADYHDYWARGMVFGTWDDLRPGNQDPEIRTTGYFRPPGYPYFLAAIYAVTGDGFLWPRLIQFGIGLLNAWVAFLLVRRLFGDPPALWAAFFMSTYWIFIFFESELQEPAIYSLVMLTLTYLALRWSKSRTARISLLIGLVIGVSALIRPNALLLLPVLAIWTSWVRHRRGELWRRDLTTWGLLALGTIVAVAPATIRNYRVTGEFIPISTNGGINLYIGNNPRANGLVYAHTEAGVLDTCYDWPGIVETLGRQLGRPLSDAEASSHFADRAVEYMTAQPLEMIRLFGVKTLLFWGPSEPADNKEVHGEHDNSIILSWNLWNFPLALAFGVAGLLLVVWRRRTAAVPMGGKRRPGGAAEAAPVSDEAWEITVLVIVCLALWWLSFLPFAMTSRYRVPIIPYLLMFGGVFLSEWIRWVRARSRRSLRTAGAWAALFVAVFLLARIDFAGYVPSYARWHYQRGLAYNIRGNIEAAIEEFRQAVGHNPNYLAANNDLGAALARVGNIEESIPYFEKTIERAPTHEIALVNLGSAYELQGRRADALNLYHRALQVNPRSVRAREGVERLGGEPR